MALEQALQADVPVRMPARAAPARPNLAMFQCSRVHLQRAVIPPSTRMFAPVIQLERSATSSATISATSFGDPRRPSRTDWANTSGGAPVASLKALRASLPPGVTTGPGDTT